jgi:ABC-2 type transport system ATP-binding protein
MVSVKGLRASYGGHVAIEGLSFEAVEGRTLTVVGPNGAGKSTLFRAMVGLHPRDKGEIRVLGCDAKSLTPEALSKLAFVPETHAEEPSLRVEELAAYRASIYPRFDRGFFQELAASFALRKEARVRELSRGQRAGLVVGLAIAQKPELLLLDDPLLGLDPFARRRIVEAILARTAEGEGTTVMAAHELGDIERVTDDVVFLGRGHGHALGNLTDLLDRVRLVRVSLETSITALDALPDVLAVAVKRDCIDVVIKRTDVRALLVALDPKASLDEAISFEAVVLAWLAHETRKERT